MLYCAEVVILRISRWQELIPSCEGVIQPLSSMVLNTLLQDQLKTLNRTKTLLIYHSVLRIKEQIILVGVKMSLPNYLLVVVTNTRF